MIVRSKAPLRIGLAGGGTDVSPYCDRYGGKILNATISKYAHAHIEPLGEPVIRIYAADQGEELTLPLEPELPVSGSLSLAIGVYNRVVRDYGAVPSGFQLTTFVDAPAGSGLGTSSTLVVAILGAFAEWMRLPLGDYDTAHLAYAIERQDLQMSGGKQDQYAATFGGVNFMEFFGEDKVIVNPLRVRSEYLQELENNLLLYYTETSRNSAGIIDVQRQNVLDDNPESLEAMHRVKEQGQMMKEALLLGQADDIGRILDFGFRYKKQMARGITNPLIDQIYQTAIEAGATGGKISGAGGGGFITFYCPNTSRYAVMNALQHFPGSFHDFQFVEKGLVTWSS